MSNCEVITIGKEVLDGRVIDTNAAYIGQELNCRGAKVCFRQSVDDNLDDIINSIKIAANRAKIIICTGGLGPTQDDLTTYAFSKYLNVQLQEHPIALKNVNDAIGKLGLTPSKTQLKQSLIPKTCEVLINKKGTAPGFYFIDQNNMYFFLPGVPVEMKTMLINEVIPKLKLSLSDTYSHTWITHFTKESNLATEFKNLIESFPEQVSISYRTRFPENHITLTAEDCDEKTFNVYKQKTEDTIKGIYFHNYNSLKEEYKSLEELILEKCTEKKYLISTIESCTGGLLASKFTDIPGCSTSYWGSIIAYSNQLKIQNGVKEKTIDSFGAVSKQVAEEMAISLNKTLPQEQKTFTISTTGIAGPTGGTTQKPVGTCFISLASNGELLDTLHIKANSNLPRLKLKKFFSQKALDLLWKHIN